MEDAIQFPKWVPDAIRENVEISGKSAKELRPSVLTYLLTDQRMAEVWHWYESALSEANKSKEGMELDACHLLFAVQDALQFPGKPGDMTPKRREQYFEKVRTQVSKLKELLRDTKFDVDWRARSYPLKTEQMEDDFRMQFIPPGAYEFEYMVCYLFNAGEMSRAPGDFPECAVMEILDNITEWTRQDDHWDRGNMTTSMGIHQQSRRGQIARFYSLLYWEHRRYGISFPPAHLATLTNVVLQLDDDEMLDEDAVRKQVTRFMERHGEPPTMLDCPF